MKKYRLEIYHFYFTKNISIFGKLKIEEPFHPKIYKDNVHILCMKKITTLGNLCEVFASLESLEIQNISNVIITSDYKI